MQNVQISLPLLRLPISAGVSLAGTKPGPGAGDPPAADLFSLDLVSDGTDAPPQVSAPTVALSEEAPEGPDLADSEETCDLPLATGGHEADQTKRNSGFAFALTPQFSLAHSGSDPEAEELPPDDKPAPAPPHPTETKQAAVCDFARVGGLATPAPISLPDEPGPRAIFAAATNASGKLPEPISPAVPNGPDGQVNGAGNLPLAQRGQSLLQPANPSPDVTSEASPESEAQPRIPDRAAAAPAPFPIEPFRPANSFPERRLAPGDPQAIAIPPSARMPRAESSRALPEQRYPPPLPGSEPGRQALSPLGPNVNTEEPPPRIGPEPAHLAASQQSQIAGTATGGIPFTSLTGQFRPADAADTPLQGGSEPSPPVVQPDNLAPSRGTRPEAPPRVMPVKAVAARSAVPGRQAGPAEPDGPEYVRNAANTGKISGQPAASALARTRINPLPVEVPLPAGTSQFDPDTAPPGAHHMPTGREISPHHMAPATRPEMPAQVPAQISQAVISASGPVTELRLSPEELGTVRIEVKTEREKVTVTLLAERPETLDLLRRHADRLVAEFRAAGFSEMNLGFGNLSAGDQGGPQPGPETPVREVSEAAIPAATPISAPDTRSGPQASLYLRL